MQIGITLKRETGNRTGNEISLFPTYAIPRSPCGCFTVYSSRLNRKIELYSKITENIIIYILKSFISRTNDPGVSKEMSRIYIFRGTKRKRKYIIRARQKFIRGNRTRRINALNRIVHLHTRTRCMSLVCRRGRSVYSTIVIFVDSGVYTL